MALLTTHGLQAGLAQEVRPAGGAALDQVIIATGAAALLGFALLLVGYGHRGGRLRLLSWLATRVAQTPLTRGLPDWAALPSVVALWSLVTALLGMYWDISLHITRGRDEGPLANIAHYPILLGLFGIFTAGVLAILMPRGERPGPAAIRIGPDWYAPTGGVLLAGAGFYALLGFPLDDIWHRIFGQDVTLWGPTHLMLIGGAGLSLVAISVLEREGQLARGGELGTGSRLGSYVRRGMIMGGLLIGLSVFQAEWDFGVPQFRMVHQPLLIALAAGCALVAARLWVGRGGALFAVGFYVVVRGGVSLVVGGVIGQLWAAIPLYLVEAIIVELAAVWLARRALLLGAVCGVLIGTVGFAAEYAWSWLVMPLPWTGDMVVEGIAMAVAGGLAGGVAGALLALGLHGRLPRPRVSRPLFAGVLVLLAVAVGNGLVVTVPGQVRAEVALGGQSEHAADRAAVRLSPGVDGPAWLQITGWQGGGLVVDRLTAAEDGTWHTSQPVPLGGSWKTLVRIHDGRVMAAVPIYLPADPAINARELPATAFAVRGAIEERQILQRELKAGVPGWVWAVASAVVLVCTLALVLSLAWGVARVSRTGRTRTRQDGRYPV